MIGVVINPHSRRNRGRKGLRRKVERILGAHGRVVETLSVDAIVGALRSFADEGRRYWVADGGDGALHWMINEAVRYFGAARASELAAYVPTGGGSVDFVALALGIPRDPMTVLTRLVAAVSRGETPRQVPVRTLQFTGTQVLYGDEPIEWRRVGFGNALAGYGANFFGPLYEEGKGKSPTRIAGLIAAAFGTAAGQGMMRGPLARFKPEALVRAEQAFLRPLHAEVRVDDVVLRGGDGGPVLWHTALNCASVPLNLASILRVFPQANGAQMHLHAGSVSAVEMARIFPRLMTGRATNHLLPNAYDGPATDVKIACIGDDEMAPVIDGELFYRLRALHVTMGPVFQMAVP